MIVKEPPTAVVMRSLQQLEGLLPLLDEITDPPSVAAIACRIAGLAATIADKTTTPEFAREVILIESGGCTPWLPGENTP